MHLHGGSRLAKADAAPPSPQTGTGDGDESHAGTGIPASSESVPTASTTAHRVTAASATTSGKTTTTGSTCSSGFATTVTRQRPAGTPRPQGSTSSVNDHQIPIRGSSSPRICDNRWTRRRWNGPGPGRHLAGGADIGSVQTFTCQACDQEWSRPTVRGNYPKWCPDCRDRVQRLNWRKVCATCGRLGVRRDGKYCSQRCQWGASAALLPHPDPSPCTPLPTRHPARTARHQQKAGAWTSGYCDICSCPFISKLRDKTCSPACQRERHKLSKAAGRAHYKAMTRGVRNDSFTLNEWASRLIEFGRSCAYCGDRHADLEVEHIVPLSRGGANDIRNVAPACRSCNQAKGARTLREWLQENNDGARDAVKPPSPVTPHPPPLLGRRG